MSITTLLSNVPNLVKVLSLSAAVGTGGAALALDELPNPMETTPTVNTAPTVSAEGLDALIPEAHLELAESNALAEMMGATAVDENQAEASDDEGPSHATGLDRAEERANAHAANGHARARAAHAANAARRAERGEPGSRGSAEARASRAAERAESRGADAPGRAIAAERAESRGADAPGRAVAAGKRDGRGRH